MKHNIIKTENYLLVVDDSEIKECYSFYPPFGIGKNITIDGELCFHIDAKNGIGSFTQRTYQTLDRNKKIIAHLPLNNSPILEGVDLLPPFEQEDDAWKHGLEDELNKLPYTKHLDDGQYNDGQLAGFEFGANWGYNKAKEKYKWTDEDVIKIVEKSRETGLTAEYLLLSLSQPKSPITFMFETEYDCCGRYENCKGCDATAEMINLRPKTTTNSQGQTILLGKYIY